MRIKSLLLLGVALLLGALSLQASPGLSDVKFRVLPAVYKSRNGFTQKVEISVKHEGKPSVVMIRLGEQSRKEKLMPGNNVFLVEIPEVRAISQLPLALTSGKEKEENLLLVNMRPVEGENAVMLQLREIGGKPAAFSVTSDKVAFTGATACDVVGAPLPGNPLDFAPWENKFIKLSW